MPIEKSEFLTTSFRFSYDIDGTEVGHAYLAIFKNDIHQEPFGLLEDLQVAEEYRGQRIASELLKAVIQTARDENCYKLLATSRLGGTRDHIHYWYERVGFESYGVEFRMNL